jgi:nucleoside-diphosphate-sugar epimerase
VLVFKLIDMTSQTVISRGIFHGLPTFPKDDGKKLSIIVTGANGISGSAMVKVLSDAPERWDRIYALSRKPRTYPASGNIVSIAVDFLNSTPEAIGEVLRDHKVKA